MKITILKYTNESMALSNQFLYTLIMNVVLYRNRQDIIAMTERNVMRGSIDMLNADNMNTTIRTSKSRPVQ